MISAPPLLAVASLSFGAALGLTPLLRALAPAIGFLDHPGDRKPHPAPTPLLGGVAVAGALVAGPLAASLLLHTKIAVPAAGVLIGATLSLALGLMDDRTPMRPAGKLVGQIVAALFLVAWGSGHGFVTLHPVLAAVAVVGVVALLNAVNFLDAMDGIVSAIVPVTGLGFVALALLHGADVNLALAWGAIGASAGFLVYNAPPARIFLGDAGSHLLGFVLAALALQALDGALTIPHIASIAAILAYPLFDVLFVVTTRLADGRPIHVGGTDHTTHRLSRVCGRWGTLAVVTSVTILGTGLGIWIWGVNDARLAVAVVGCLGLGYAIFGTWLRRLRPTSGFDT